MLPRIVGFNLGGVAATPRLSVTLPPHQPYSKPSSQLSIVQYRQSPKIKIRAFSAENHILLESSAYARKRTIDSGVDYTGRRFTIGDVVNKDTLLNFNQPRNSLQTLGVAIIRILQAAAIFLVKVSFVASFAASSAAGLAVTFFSFPFMVPLMLLTMDRGDLLGNISDVLPELFNGMMVQFIFDYVFGKSGDPNQGIEEKRWKMIGQYIALNGGVVIAEEVAPYLDPHNTENMDNESYMLPVLKLFNGHSKVDEEGNILYHFPSVHCIPLPRSNCGKEYAGRWADRGIQVDKCLKETEWELVKCDNIAIECVVQLLLFKVACSMVGAFSILRIGSRSCMYYTFLPLLMMYVIYIACFGVIASKRASFINQMNAEIIKRNEAREYHAKALELPNRSLESKLSSAREMARKASIGNHRIVYKNENDLYEQQEYERQEWDQRLKKVGSKMKT